MADTRTELSRYIDEVAATGAVEYEGGHPCEMCKCVAPPTATVLKIKFARRTVVAAPNPFNED